MAAATLLLDLDGTVWDSRRWYAETIARLSSGSISAIEDDLSAGGNIARLVIDHGVTNARLARAASERAAILRLYERVFETLDSLRERGTLIGVVSNLPGWLVRPLLQSTGLESYLAATATPRPGVPAKPQPHGIRRVLQEMDREADARTWFVGDGAVDGEAAEAAGVQFAWASYGYETEMPRGTVKVLECFNDVLQL